MSDPKVELERVTAERDQAVRDAMRAEGQLRRYRLAVVELRQLCIDAEHHSHRRDAAVPVTDIRDALEDLT